MEKCIKKEKRTGSIVFPHSSMKILVLFSFTFLRAGLPLVFKSGVIWDFFWGGATHEDD